MKANELKHYTYKNLDKYCPKCNQTYTRTSANNCPLCGKPLLVYTENMPKCPTCHSLNVQKISNTKKAIHGVAFGILSNTALSQFECRNCGYKW